MNTPKDILVNFKAAQLRFEEEQKTRISVNIASQKIFNKTTPPPFNHKEIDWLYTNGLHISKDKITAILNLPKQSLVEDLKLVLQDSIDRYRYFNELSKTEGWNEEKMNFLVHAVFLLGELKAKEGLPKIFETLSQSEAYIDFYYGDFITECIWEPLFKIVENHFEVCKPFLYKAGVFTYSKTIFTDILSQITFHHPNKREEVIFQFKEILTFFLESNLKDNIVDSDLLGLIICNIIEINGVELLPEIEQLFRKGYVSKGICGDLNSIKVDLTEKPKYQAKYEILSILNRYQQITSTWSGYQEENNSPFLDTTNYLNSYSTPIAKTQKIRRNDSCPCGSGKKYKKCCL